MNENSVYVYVDEKGKTQPFEHIADGYFNFLIRITNKIKFQIFFKGGHISDIHQSKEMHA